MNLSQTCPFYLCLWVWCSMLILSVCMFSSTQTLKFDSMEVPQDTLNGHIFASQVRKWHQTNRMDIKSYKNLLFTFNFDLHLFEQPCEDVDKSILSTYLLQLRAHSSVNGLLWKEKKHVRQLNRSVSNYSALQRIEREICCILEGVIY